MWYIPHNTLAIFIMLEILQTILCFGLSYEWIYKTTDNQNNLSN